MKVAIIGNGISGVTAARFVRKLSDHDITIISAETDYFFSRTALMYIYMGHMNYSHTKPYEDHFWKKNRIQLVRGRVTSIDFHQKQLALDSAGIEESPHGPPPAKMTYDKLVIACGSTPSFYDWPGQDLAGVRGLYSLQDLAYLESFSEGLNHGVVVGGGLIGIELAEMLHSRGKACTMLVREKSYWNRVLPPEESAMVNRHIKHEGIDLRLEAELDEILGDDQGRCRAVRTKSGQEIPCQYVGITTGVRPNISWMSELDIDVDRGILVDPYLQTSQPDVYAIGDCAQLRQPPSGRRPIEAVWYVGRMMGETVAHTICGHPQVYDPGIWFNSAKFFHIEYQIYGEVPAHMPDHLDSIYVEEGERAVRIVFEKASKAVRGFHLMGIRFRHEVCEAWIRQGAPLKQVLVDLGAADFDPAFFRSLLSNLSKAYEARFGEGVSIRQKRSWWSARKILSNA